MQYQTIFELGQSITASTVPLVVFLALGALLFLLGIHYFISLHRRKPAPVKKMTAIFMVIIGALWLSLSPTVLSVIKDTNALQELYETDQFRVAEGEVKVLREQSREGDYIGDVIEVDGKQFAINYYTETHGYNVTIANGGVLKDGAQVRLRYIDRLIVKVELAI